MSETKDFPLGHILSITTGILVCEGEDHPIDGVYKILNFMTGDSNFTHQIPRLSEEARPVLLRQHPQLAEVSSEGIGRDNWRPWLNGLKTKYGETLPVMKMTVDEHEYREPISEAAEIFSPDRLLVIKG